MFSDWQCYVGSVYSTIIFSYSRKVQSGLLILFHKLKRNNLVKSSLAFFLFDKAW